MVDQFWIFALLLVLGILLTWGYRAVAKPSKPWILLVPLILPAVLWLAIGGRLTSVKEPGGLEITFSQAASAPVSELVDVAALPLDATIETTPDASMMVEQRTLVTEPDTSQKYSGLGAVAVTQGEKTGRIFLWYIYDEIEPERLETILLEERWRLANDVAREYLVFGPEIGRIDCYLPATDLVLRASDVRRALRALEAAPRAEWGRSLRDSGVCQKPLQRTVAAIDALAHLSGAGHDEGIVVRESGSYVGLIFRDRIVTHLLRALSGTNALSAGTDVDR